MAQPARSGGDRSVHIGGKASGNVIQTGDHNIASVQYQQVILPPPESVDIRAEFAALREVLSQVNTPDRRKMANALSDAEDELAKPQPDKDEVGKALSRALDYAKKAEGFAKVIETLKPHVTNAASWLGSHWRTLLSVVGFAA